MIKVIACVQRHPTNHSEADFYRYWANLHGQLVAKTPELRKYVQLHSLPEAYSSRNRRIPTHDGASMTWYDDLDVLRNPPPSPKLSEVIDKDADADLYANYIASGRFGDPDVVTLRETIEADDEQLFDRSTEWPMDMRRTNVVVNERVVIDGEVRPGMLRVIMALQRMPGLTVQDLHKRWFEVHGKFGGAVPGTRRYIQNHGIPEAYAFAPMTHDGYSEVWFDDLKTYQQARDTPESRALLEDDLSLFARPRSGVIGREVVIKE